jgi:hypothetical protein
MAVDEIVEGESVLISLYIQSLVPRVKSAFHRRANIRAWNAAYLLRSTTLPCLGID